MPLPPENETLLFPIDAGCFGCSPTSEAGLRLKFFRAGDEICSRYSIPDHFHGAPDVAHGGIVATLIDEVSCASVYFLTESGVVTGELTVRYMRPCPVERELLARGRIVDRSHKKYAVVECEVSDGEEVLVRSTGKFFYSPLVGPKP
jgi:uncharacterized protein (TIGR00369 family)